MKINKTLYTVGHSKHSLDEFLAILKHNDINCIVDVRSIPFSKICSQFNEENIKHFLKQNGIYYIFMGKEFGARRNDLSLYTKEGYLDFELTAKSKDFLEGVKRIKDGVNKGFNIAFMCTEKDPIDCHRNILVAHEFCKLGYKVKNVLYDGSIEEQQQLEIRLLDMYFKNRNQGDLFGNNLESIDEKELISQAYKLRNKDIGYSISREKE